MSQRAKPRASLRVSVSNHQRNIRLPLRHLQAFWQAAAQVLRKEEALPLSTIEFHLITQPEMQKLHARHLDDSEPTDVITFTHGEIFICPVVARKQAPDWNRSLQQEVALYGIHGLLHLSGWNDATSSEAQRMAQAQDALLEKLLKRYPL